MNMRITAGALRGRKLFAPENTDEKSPTRPTKDRVKQAMFNMLAARMEFPDCKEVLDLFCGSGALGLEALSRGVQHATFVDMDVQYIHKNVEAMGLQKNSTVSCENVLRFSPTTKANLILLDPPYNQGLLEPILNRAPELGEQASLWMLECDVKENLTIPTHFELLKEKSYGKSKLVLLELML